MINETGQELRRIRIVLVIIAILTLFAGGNRTVTVDQDSNYQDPYLYNSNMVPLGNGYFGVLTSDTNNDSQTVKVYLFDSEKKEVNFINEKELNDIEDNFEN